MSISLLLMVIALVLFGVAAFGVASGRFNLIAAGLMFWVLAQLIGNFNVS